MLRILLTSILLCLPLTAQTNANKGSIGGFVSNSGGSPVAQARVEAVSQATGLNRDVFTNSSGVYEFDGLEPGAYDIRVESDGFGMWIRRIDLMVGGKLRVNVGLAMSANAEKVDVSSSSLSVAESVPTDLMTEDAIRNLPINGRRFQDFATLSPLVQALSETRGQFSFAGQRGIYSNVMLDGVDYNNPFWGGILSGERSNYAFTIPQSAIQEFQVVGMAPSVEYGHTTGGILNATTRSGANAYHGDGFYQIRDQSMGVADPLGRKSLDRQQQLGGASGGPIRRDRLFFFLAAEQQFANFPRSVKYPALDAFAGKVTPDIAPAYNFLRSLERPFNQTNDVTAFTGRGDYQTRRGDRITLRSHYSRNQALNAAGIGTSVLPNINQAFDSNGAIHQSTHSAGGQWTTIFSGSMVNDLRVNYNREELGLKPNAIGPSVDLGVIGSFGTASTLPSVTCDFRFQAADGFTRSKGRHSLSFGFDYSYVGVEQTAGSNQFGSFSIAADPLRTLQILSGVQGNRFDDPSVIYSRQVGGLHFSGNVHQIAFYGQDSWRATPSFTLTLGLRWEGQLNPQPVTDNAFLVLSVRDTRFPLGGLDPTRIRNNFDQWSPRLSFAWDPMGRQSTVIRFRTGLFYGQTPLAYLAAPLTNVSMAPSDLSLQIAPSSAGTVYQQFLAGGFDLNKSSLNSLPIFTVPDVWVQAAGKPDPFAHANVTTTTGKNFRNPRTAQVGFSIEQRLRTGIVVSYEFGFVSAVHLERNVDFNIPLPFVRPGDLSLRPFFGLRSGTPRPNPDLGYVLARDASAHSRYTSNAFRLDYRRGRFQLGAHYTLSFNKSDDDNERQLTTFAYQNPFDFGREYNWSSIDARHRADGFATWQAPHGFDLSTLFHFHSGLPIDASTGGDTSELLTGNLGNRPMVLPGVVMLRNAFRNQSFRTIDLRIAKGIVHTERIRMQVYGDLFNALNFDNVALVPSNLYPDNPAFVYGLGVLPNGQLATVDPRFMKLRLAGGCYDPATTAQVGTPLQAQLGLRVQF